MKLAYDYFFIDFVRETECETEKMKEDKTVHENDERVNESDKQKTVQKKLIHNFIMTNVIILYELQQRPVFIFCTTAK